MVQYKYKKQTRISQIDTISIVDLICEINFGKLN